MLWGQTILKLKDLLKLTLSPFLKTPWNEIKGGGKVDSELSLLCSEDEAEDSEVPSIPFNLLASFTMIKGFFRVAGTGFLPSFPPLAGAFLASDCCCFFCCLCAT